MDRHVCHQFAWPWVLVSVMVVENHLGHPFCPRLYKLMARAINLQFNYVPLHSEFQ